jgi:ubiquinone/menaquinone biosynthesis C-methylase UbiE
MIYKLTDPDSLRTDQYKDSSNLSARAALHQRFSTNQIGWHFWVFDQFNFPEDCKILEVGSGPGYLWQQNQNRFPTSWNLCLSDISIGMLEEARTALGSTMCYRFAVHDATNIPFPENEFDAIIANHMLYHLPDIPAALKEVKRVLKPNSCLYAATNGPAHLQEIKAWKSQFFPDIENPDWGTPTLRFSMENGEDLLNQDFKDIHFLEYPDSLLVDQVEPIIRYIRSYTKLEETDARTTELRDFLQRQITKNGSIQITKESGMFVAVKY